MKPLNKILICFFAISFFACSNQKVNDFERLEKYFKDTHNKKLGNDINKIVVISEGKSCPTCEISFAKTILQCFSDSTVFLVTAKGNYVDIQPFLGLEKNCYFDWQLNLKEYPEFGSSKVIYLKNNVIDTIVVINSSEIMQQLEFFKTRN